MFKKIFAGGLVLVAVLMGIFVHNKVSYVGEQVDPLMYFDEFQGNTNNLVYEDKRVAVKEPIQIIDDKVFVNCMAVNEYINDRMFYDQQEQVVTLTNAKEVVRLHEGENTISFSGIEGTYSIKKLGDYLYIEKDLIKDLFGTEIKLGEDEKLFVATNTGVNQNVAKVKKKAYLRTHPQKKSTVIEVISRGEQVNIYEEEGEYVRVRSENGIIGYLPSADLKNYEVVEATDLPQVEDWAVNPLGKTVKLMWDDMTTRSEKDFNTNKYARMQNVNVLAPAWFEFASEDGTLSDIATTSYVQQAHNRGMNVWPILRHNFSKPQLTEEILSSTAKRQYVIDQLIGYAKQYGFDGVNVDIENIQNETSDVWVEFMRELYPQLKAEGLIVSVDVYTPSSWSDHYEREKVGESSDYFIVMAYDQHWSGSENAGSVADMTWTEEGIVATLEEVPSEKLVLGIPFYTRRWKEDAQGLSSKSYSMSSMKELIDSLNIVPTYDETSGQNYVEYVKEGATYKVWLEDALSVQKRIALMEKYNLAGYGAWRLGYETNDIWDILNKVE